MHEDDFPPDVAGGIVAHMNEDHADAVLAIARAFGNAPGATGARLLAISPRRLDIEIDGEETVTVPVEPPISPLDTVRARLVAMTREARTALAGSSG